MSEKFACDDVAGEWPARSSVSGECGPIESTSYPMKYVPSGFTNDCPSIRPVFVNTQFDASSTTNGCRDWVTYMTPSICSSDRITVVLRNRHVRRYVGVIGS